MKNLLYIIVVSLSFVVFSCEEADRLMYDYPNDRVGIVFKSSTDSVLRKTFVYDPETCLRDTVFVELKTIGFLYDYDREVKFKQVMVDGKNNAEAGVHYVPFDSPELKEKMHIPAGKNIAAIPVILLRDNSLKEQEVFIQVTLVENEYFQLGFPKNITQNIIFSDKLSKPLKWDFGKYTIGDYGTVKHRFLIDKTGFLWDDATFQLLFRDDAPYGNFIYNKMKDELMKENERLKIEDPSHYPLSEADGTEVKFK